MRLVKKVARVLLSVIVASFLYMASAVPVSHSEAPVIVHKGPVSHIHKPRPGGSALTPPSRSREIMSGYFTVTMYTANDPGMDGRGITASGTKAKEWHTIAVDRKLIPFGSRIYIPELSHLPNKGWFVAEDTGGAIKGRKLDIYVADRDYALRFGRQRLFVIVYEPQ